MKYDYSFSFTLHAIAVSFPVDHEPNMHSIIEKMGLSKVA